MHGRCERGRTARHSTFRRHPVESWRVSHRRATMRHVDTTTTPLTLHPFTVADAERVLSGEVDPHDGWEGGYAFTDEPELLSEYVRAVRENGDPAPFGPYLVRRSEHDGAAIGGVNLFGPPDERRRGRVRLRARARRCAARASRCTRCSRRSSSPARRARRSRAPNARSRTSRPAVARARRPRRGRPHRRRDHLRDPALTGADARSPHSSRSAGSSMIEATSARKRLATSPSTTR